MSDNRKLLGVRVAPDLHKVIKQAALDNDVTIQDYVIGLILADVQTGQNKTKNDFWKELREGKG